MLSQVRTASSVLAAVLVASGAAVSQQPLKYPDTVASNLPQPEHVKLYNNEPGVLDPTPLPLSVPPSQAECKGLKGSGTVTLTFVVDANGAPRNVYFKQALANQIDLLALEFLLNSRFQPATINGAPVSVGRDIEMHLQVCDEKQPGTTKDSTKETTRLLSVQKEKISAWRNSPNEANLAPVQMPADAQGDHEHPGPDFKIPQAIVHGATHAQGMSGAFSFGIRIDEHGISHIEKVLKSTNPALLNAAAEVILNTRSTPALKNGMPVPVHVIESIEIHSN